MKGLKILCSVLWIASTAWAQAPRPATCPFVGVTWTVRIETAPRPLRVYVLDINLAAPGIRFRLTPPDGPLHTRKQTTLEYLKEQHAQIAVNGHFFEPWPPPSPDPGTATLVGLAASDGRVYAPFLDKPPKPQAIRPDSPGLNIDAHNRASIVHRSSADPNGYAPAENVTLCNALAGSEQIVTHGKVTAADSKWNKQLAPRTAIGLTGDRHLILLVVDGRQPGISEGMKVAEVAELLAREYRVLDALNLDGGGSTTLAIADPTPRVVNVPVGKGNVAGTERAVGSNLAVFAQWREPATLPRGDATHVPGLPGTHAAYYWAALGGVACIVAGLAFRSRRRRSHRTSHPQR